MPSPAPHPVVCWLDADQTHLVRAVCERANLEVIAAGTASVGRSGELAQSLGPSVKAIDDLRSLLTHPDAAAALIATPGDFASTLRSTPGSPGAEDAGVLADCRARGVPVFSFEPMPASLLELGVPGLGSAESTPGLSLGPAADTTVGLAPGLLAALPTFCPVLRLSKPVRDAAEILQQMGPLQTLLIESWAAPAHASLGARVFDAADTVLALMGTPDRVDASHVAPASARARSPRSAPTDTLAGLAGDLTANLRFVDGRAAAIVASNRAGRFSRVITAISERGRLRIYDDGLVWTGPDGRTIDASRDPARIRGSTDDPALHAVIAIADQITRTLDPAIPPPPPTDLVRLLATCGALLLSARTGQSESPETILRMARAG